MLEKIRKPRELHLTFSGDAVNPIGHIAWSDQILEDGKVIADSVHRDCIDLSNLNKKVGITDKTVADVLGSVCVEAVSKHAALEAKHAELVKNHNRLTEANAKALSELSAAQKKISDLQKR